MIFWADDLALLQFMITVNICTSRLSKPLIGKVNLTDWNVFTIHRFITSQEKPFIILPTMAIFPGITFPTVLFVNMRLPSCGGVYCIFVQEVNRDQTLGWFQWCPYVWVCLLSTKTDGRGVFFLTETHNSQNKGTSLPGFFLSEHRRDELLYSLTS